MGHLHSRQSCSVESNTNVFTRFNDPLQTFGPAREQNNYCRLEPPTEKLLGDELLISRNGFVDATNRRRQRIWRMACDEISPVAMAKNRR